MRKIKKKKKILKTLKIIRNIFLSYFTHSLNVKKKKKTKFVACFLKYEFFFRTYILYGIASALKSKSLLQLYPLYKTGR